MKKLRVTVDGKVFEVTVELLDAAASSAPVALAPAASGPTHSAPATGSAGTVASPLAGKVVSVDVKAGQSVAKGAQLLTLEAMKMNTFVFAPKAGVVSTIQVQPGEVVEEGATLLTMA